MKICVEQKEAYLDICTNRENIRCLKPVDIYCVTNQKVVCCKYLNLSYIIELVVSMLTAFSLMETTIIISMNFCQINAEYPDLLYRTTVQWFFAMVTFYCYIVNKGPRLKYF